MIKRIFSFAIILTFIATSLFYTGTVQAENTTLANEAGIAAYAKVTAIDLVVAKQLFLTIEYEATGFLIGTVDMGAYEPEYDPYVYVDSDGWVIAFYPPEDPAAKIVDVMARSTDVTLLEKAVALFAPGADASHYDFSNPTASSLTLFAEDKADGNAFTLSLPATFAGKISYGFYQTYQASFTIDNEVIDQVNFVATNADFTGLGNYGTIFGHFPADPTLEPLLVPFPLGVVNEFAVASGSLYAFGALAIEGDVTGYEEDNADFVRPIILDAPDGFDASSIAFDFTPTAPVKTAPIDGVEQPLNPILSWNPSTAPNYEYCIDTTAPDVDPLTEDCDTGWKATTATSVALSNLFFDTTYYWQVRAVNSTATVEAGAWFSFTTTDRANPVPFAKLSSVLAEPVGGTIKLTMTWESSYGAYYYEYCVDTTAACIAPELWHNVGLATTATFSDLLLNTTYFWQVRAVNYDAIGTAYYTDADGEGKWFTFTTRTFSKINPLDEAVYDISKPLMWEATPDAISYEYCYDTDTNDTCDSGWKSTKLVTQASFKKLAAGDYKWQVRANVGTVTSIVYQYANGGDWWEFTVLPKSSRITLFKVSPLNGAIDQPNSVSLTWKATKIVGGYEYCYFPIDDTDTTPIADDDTCSGYDSAWTSTTSTSATIGPLLNATTYYWQVRANIGTLAEPNYIYADKGDYWAFTTIQ